MVEGKNYTVWTDTDTAKKKKHVTGVYYQIKKQ